MWLVSFHRVEICALVLCHIDVVICYKIVALLDKHIAKSVSHGVVTVVVFEEVKQTGESSWGSEAGSQTSLCQEKGDEGGLQRNNEESCTKGLFLCLVHTFINYKLVPLKFAETVWCLYF